MVNKGALAVLAVVVIGVVGVGMLVGTVLNGGDAPATSNDNNGGGAENVDGNTTATPGPNVTVTSTAGPADDRRTPILPRRFSSGAVAENVTRLINEERQNRSLDRLDHSGETARELTDMAEGHSLDMADVGHVAHNVSGTDTAQRYSDHNLYDTCKYSDPSNNYEPGRTDTFEVIAVSGIGQHHRVDGNETFVENESQAARIVVEEWLDQEESREALLVDQFNRVGVGVEITDRNAVYVTVNLCS